SALTLSLLCHVQFQDPPLWLCQGPASSPCVTPARKSSATTRTALWPLRRWPMPLQVGHGQAPPSSPAWPLQQKISVVPNQFLDPRHFPIIMGINGGTRCLSCGTAAQPTLMLEAQIMAVILPHQEAKRFTFTCSATGSTHRFESVAYPGWYLSTSPRNDQPLQVTNRPGEAEITNFYFKKV
uniref:Interleukin-1 n=1 Tax=Pelusios castaneus TaxID=367368 RepID=A0A8C8SBJ2_9SAUR